MRNGLINSLIFTVTLLLSLLVAEGVARVATHFPIHSPAANLMHDERLFYRVDSSVEGIDSLGFRNPKSLHKSFPKLAALGDSHTFGYNVRSKDSWPALLAEMIGEPVYNFGVGSYGLLQYVETARLAAQMGARTIIVGFFPLNDLSICAPARLAYWTRAFFSEKALRDQLKSYCGFDESMLGQTPQKILELKYKNLNRWLLSNSALFSMGKYAKDLIAGQRDVFSRNISQKYNSVTEATERCGKPGKDFIFKVHGSKDFIAWWYQKGFIDYYKQNLSHEFSSIVFRKALREMKDVVRKHGARILFVSIPSEVRVVEAYLSKIRFDQALPAWVKRLSGAESKFTAALLDTVRAMDLPAIDATDRVVEAYGRAMKAGQIFYFCDDGHPLENAYRAYARAALTLLRSR